MTVERTDIPSGQTAGPSTVIRQFVGMAPRLGDLLVAKGLITAAQLEECLAESRLAGELLGRTLIKRRYLFADELARTLAEQLNLPYVRLQVTGFDRLTARLMPIEEGRCAGAIPIGIVGGRVRVVFADPCDEMALAVVRRYIGDFDTAIAELSDIDLAWQMIESANAPVRRW